MTKCYFCRKEQENFICDECVGFKEEREVRRRQKEPHEELKLEWYRNEKSWEDNIRSRRMVEKNGKRFMVYKDKSGAEKPLPSASKNIWAKPKER